MLSPEIVTKEEKRILRIVHGSRLYGTSTPESDLDYKEVFIPSSRQILLGRFKEGRSSGPDKSGTPGAKNQAGDVDLQQFAVSKFFKMITAGDIIGCELLFAPDWAIEEKTDEFDLIVSQANIFLSNKVAGYVGYCRSQANKYGIRGSRIAAVRGLLTILEEAYQKFPTKKLSLIWGQLAPYMRETEHCSIDDIVNHGTTSQSMLHLNCCGRKVPYTVTIKEAYTVYKRVLDEYGHRALQAERNEGIDWKAVSHAVRVGRQALELLDTGWIQFPRPDALELLEIKRGERDYREIAVVLDELLTKIEAGKETSKLPPEPNWEAIDDLLLRLHLSQI